MTSSACEIQGWIRAVCVILAAPRTPIRIALGDLWALGGVCAVRLRVSQPRMDDMAAINGAAARGSGG